MKNSYSLKIPTGKKYYYYKLPGEKTYHSTGHKVKAKAKKFVEELVYGDSKQIKSEVLKDFTENFFIIEKCQLLRRMQKKAKNVTEEMAKMRRGHLCNHILPKFGKREISTISALDIDDWLIDLERANKTKNHILGTFRLILDEAMLKGIIDKNPARQIRQFPDNAKQRDPVSQEELSIFFPSEKDALIRIWGDMKWATMYYLMVSTGIRLGEACALTWSDWNYNFNVLHIHKAVKNTGKIGGTKNGKERIVIILESALRLLREWKSNAVYTEDDDLMFCHTRHKPLDRNSCAKHFRKALKNAGIDIGDRNIVGHSLRHTMNTTFRKSVDDDTLRLFTGHLDSRMTDNYDHPNIQDNIQKVIPYRKQMEETWEKNFKNEEKSI